MARESIEVLKECEAFLEGHFLLSSGRHSGAYCQMAYLQQYPEKCAEVMAHVAEKLKDTDVDVIVGPAMGGIVYAYELGRQLGKRAIFTERVDNVMTLKRFAIHPGERCIIAEDVVTTGVSSLETKRVIEEAGGICLGITCVVDRTPRSSVPDPHPGQCPEAGSAQLCSRRMPHLQGGQVAPGPPGQPQNEGSSKADAVKELGVIAWEIGSARTETALAVSKGGRTVCARP